MYLSAFHFLPILSCTLVQDTIVSHLIGYWPANFCPCFPVFSRAKVIFCFLLCLPGSLSKTAEAPSNGLWGSLWPSPPVISLPHFLLLCVLVRLASFQVKHVRRSGLWYHPLPVVGTLFFPSCLPVTSVNITSLTQVIPSQCHLPWWLLIIIGIASPVCAVYPSLCFVFHSVCWHLSLYAFSLSLSLLTEDESVGAHRFCLLCSFLWTQQLLVCMNVLLCSGFTLPFCVTGVTGGGHWEHETP